VIQIISRLAQIAVVSLAIAAASSIARNGKQGEGKDKYPFHPEVL
jgi:hypothetical protein